MTETDWSFVKQQGKIDKFENLDVRGRYGVLSKVLKASDEEKERLSEIFQDNRLDSLVRRTAIRRTFQLNKEKPLRESLDTLRRTAFDQKDTDNDTRVRAYEAFLSLRKLANKPLTVEELAEEHKLLEIEDSDVMKWLLSFSL